MAIQFEVLTVAVPPWLVAATDAPRRLISGTMRVSTFMVIAFQVHVGRAVTSCSLLQLAAGSPGPGRAAAMRLLAPVVVHTVGELWHSAAGFEVSFALASKHASGQYLGVFGLGAGLAETAGPDGDPAGVSSGRRCAAGWASSGRRPGQLTAPLQHHPVTYGRRSVIRPSDFLIIPLSGSWS